MIKTYSVNLDNVFVTLSEKQVIDTLSNIATLPVKFKLQTISKHKHPRMERNIWGANSKLTRAVRLRLPPPRTFREWEHAARRGVRRGGGEASIMAPIDGGIVYPSAIGRRSGRRHTQTFFRGRLRRLGDCLVVVGQESESLQLQGFFSPSSSSMRRCFCGTERLLNRLTKIPRSC